MHFDSFDNQISAKLSFTVQTFKKQNSMDMEKYNGLMIDVHYLVRQPQINNGIVIINFADNNAFVLYYILFLVTIHTGKVYGQKVGSPDGDVILKVVRRAV